MIVVEVSLWIQRNLDDASESKIANIVSDKISGSGIISAMSKCILNKSDHGVIYADRKFVSSIPHRIKNRAIARRGLWTAKFIAYLLLLANAGFVTAVTNPKGDIEVDVTVPKEAERGSTANLRCEWHLRGGKNLYSVKWYKDEHEFFRYMPDNQERIQMFPQSGIKLDESASTENSIRLIDLTLDSSGQYKCEVSTEGPSFATEYKTGNLTIIALPERAPQITGLATHYAVGENLTANCTAWPSIPKASLQWIINGKPVPKEYTVVHPPLDPEPFSSTPNSLGLSLQVESRHFTGGEGVVEILCVTYVGSKRFEAKEIVHLAHVNNQRLSAGDLRGAGTDTMQGCPKLHLLTVLLGLLGLHVAT